MAKTFRLDLTTSIAYQPRVKVCDTYVLRNCSYGNLCPSVQLCSGKTFEWFELDVLPLYVMLSMSSKAEQSFSFGYN